jgi:CRP-like cAMP-binding protein
MSPLAVNLLLASLSPSSRKRLMDASTAVPLPIRTNLYEPEETPAYAYFMTSGIASVVTSVADGGTAEVGLIGREGLAGGLHLLGPALVPTSCFIQLEATALRMPLSELRNAFNSNEEIRDRILECVQEQTLSLAQIAGCHRLHTAEQRLARWLLMAQDRTQSDVLVFTQEFLAMMLGSRRTTVTAVAGSLQSRGIIEYRRGRVMILDREKLEAAACDCYEVMRRLYSSLYKRELPEARNNHSQKLGISVRD